MIRPKFAQLFDYSRQLFDLSLLMIKLLSHPDKKIRLRDVQFVSNLRQAIACLQGFVEPLQRETFPCID